MLKASSSFETNIISFASVIDLYYILIVGKTCFLITSKRNIFPEEYVPSIFDDYTSRMEINLYALWDTRSMSTIIML
jgi:hypothetical protein